MAIVILLVFSKPKKFRQIATLHLKLEFKSSTSLFRNYALKSIVNIEKNHDIIRGNRYLLELVFQDHTKNKANVRLADFVYKFHNSSNLCKPNRITWQRKVIVNVILTVKNQGSWAHHFINEISRICRETGDDHVNIIVVDYGSPDVDIENALKRYVKIA